MNNEDLEKTVTDKDAEDVLHTRQLSYFGGIAQMGCHRYP